MKITGVEAIPLRIPQRTTHRPSAGGLHPESDVHIVVKVFTDAGIVGLGEAWRLTPHAVVAFVQEALCPLLVGQDPAKIGALWRKMFFATFRYGRKGLALNAISGVEIALWDILGKAHGVAVYQLLGGACWDQIRAYASLSPLERPEDAATEAAERAADGYHLVKLHQTDLKSVELARHAIGPDVELAIDVNGVWTPRQAILNARKMQAYDVRWLEEPVRPMDDYNGLRCVRDHVALMIATGENEYTHFGFKAIVETGAADLLQPDVTKSGGLLACRKVLAMAEAWNLLVIPHSFYYGPGAAATAHFVLANPLSDEMEVNATPIEQDFIVPTFRPVHGNIAVPYTPGLGIEIDEEVLTHYRIDR